MIIVIPDFSPNILRKNRKKLHHIGFENFILLAFDARKNPFKTGIISILTTNQRLGNIDLLSSFLSALNLFSKDIVKETIERINFQDFTFVIKKVKQLLFTHIIKGHSYRALRKLTNFINLTENSPHGWSELEKDFLYPDATYIRKLDEFVREVISENELA